MQPGPLNCPLCGRSEPVASSALPSDLPNAATDLVIRECRGCGLAWQYPVVRSVEQSVDRHTQKYREKLEGSYFDPARRQAIARTEMAFIEQLRGEPGTLLDVGAGDGASCPSHRSPAGAASASTQPAKLANFRPRRPAARQR